MDEQTDLVAAFSELTGADSETAYHVLEAHGWDINAGVDFFLENGSLPLAPRDLQFHDADDAIVVDDEERGDAIALAVAGAAERTLPCPSLVVARAISSSTIQVVLDVLSSLLVVPRHPVAPRAVLTTCE